MSLTQPTNTFVPFLNLLSARAFASPPSPHRHRQRHGHQNEAHHLEAYAQRAEIAREHSVVVQLAHALPLRVRVPVAAAGVDERAEENRTRYGAQGVHEELLQAEADRVHFVWGDRGDEHFQVGEEQEGVEEHEQEDADVCGD